MTIGQFLEPLSSKMLMCSIMNTSGKVVFENYAKSILQSDCNKDLINIEILGWDINDDGSLMINIE